MKVFDHHGLDVENFFAFDEGFRGGVTVGVVDRNGDGSPDIVVGAGVGAEPHLRSFDCTGPDPVAVDDFFAFNADFDGGIFAGGRSV